MRNPLNKRLKREIVHEAGKYAVIFIFIAGMISLASGFLVASSSMEIAYDESFEKYNIEDGNIEFSEELDDELKEEIEEENELTLYENFYKEYDTDDIDSSLRVFKKREEIDLECLMSGEFPEADNEIAIDRMYAVNNEIKVGDELSYHGKDYKVSGFVALSDYSALFAEPTDMMFDAVKFGVGVVTPKAFDSISDIHLHYSYSWKYDKAPADSKKADKMSSDFVDSLKTILTDSAKERAEKVVEETIKSGKSPEEAVIPEPLTIENYIPEYSNQAIIFTGDDVTGDNAMITVFLYIMIVIVAFIFAVTTANTIAKEAKVIGTLRASGYKKSELVLHYIKMPIIVTLVAALIGNILGYTWLKQIFADLYYNSYSLPTYVTVWNTEAFIKTTVVPVILMFLINLLILTVRLNISPLKFMRGDLSSPKKKKSFRLHTSIPIMHRFRLRIVFQNIPHYIVIVLGVFLANVVLLFGCAFQPMLDSYQEIITDSLICEDQYILKEEAKTEDDSAEKYSITSLETVPGRLKAESVSVFGIAEDSDHVKIDFADDKSVYISSAYAKKNKLEKGDKIRLEEKYADGEYEFTVGGIYEYAAQLAVFMPSEQFNDVFDKGSGYFNGYFSNKTLDDIDEKSVAAIITEEDMTKTSRQLKVSMGGMANIVRFFALIMFILIIYLISKIIIEKNSQSISMTKILGYNNREINGLYTLVTSIVSILSMLVTEIIALYVLSYLVVYVMSTYPGYIEFNIPFYVLAEIFGLGVLSYAVVAWLLMQKIKRIPMTDALKNAE